MHIYTYTGPSKYVPPHLRNVTQSSGADVNNNSNNNNNDNVNNSNYQRSASSLSASYNNSGGGGRGGGRGSSSSYGRGSGGGGGRGGYYNNDNRPNGGTYAENGGGPPAPPLPPPPTSQNSRWSNNEGGNGGGGGSRYNNNGGGRGGYNGSGGSGSSMMGGGGPRRNERNFHGDMSPDKRLEQRLFHSGDKQTTGINFDNYDKIPCEVSGQDIPLPIDTYTVETIGEDLYRNTQLCGYSRPTPVQKYSIPIGQQGRDLMACAQTGSGVSSVGEEVILYHCFHF